MIGAGCSVGYFTEYVPCGHSPKADWCLSEERREAFRQSVLNLRSRKPMILIQFPADEYGPDNQCTAAGRASLHINAQGDVEPCPFVPIAADNIRQGGLLAACQSRFMKAIRGRPEVLRRGRFACALFEHSADVEAIGRDFAARPSA
jgi:MoaA/NifB/PqqE/SkfB family radical SAM enzyme